MNTAEHSDEPLALPEALAALAALLPALLIALPAPISWLEGDPWPQYSAAALALFASLPALIFLVARRPARVPRGAWLVLVPILIAVLWRSVGTLHDELEASRALHLLLAASAAFLGTALLGARAIRVYARGLCVISLLLLAGMWISPAGVLGNSGSLSHMALAGAASGLWFLWRGSVAERVLGACALGLYLEHAASTPVLAGSASLLAAVLVLGIANAQLRRHPAVITVGMLTLAALLAPLLRLSDATQPAPTESVVVAAAAGNTGGIGVRLSVWKASLGLALESPLTGCGPGQFAAAFPPWRSVEEIERSSLGRTLAAETEVEHPHNDWMDRLCEGGLLSLACFVMLALLVLQSVLSLPGRDSPLAIAALALLVNSCVHGVLSYDAGSAVLGLGVFGALLSREASPARARSVRWAGFLLIAALALEFPRARAVMEHGTALSGIGKEISSSTLERSVEKALAACPDSVHARALRARLSGKELDWLAVLDQRPDRFEAWMQLGNLRAAAGDFANARTAYERALRLDPWHPGLLENRLTLLSRTGTLAETQGALEALRSRKSVSAEWLRNRAFSAWLHGNEASSRWLFAQAALEPWPEGPEQAYAIYQQRKKDDDKLAADFFESIAQRGFARAKAEQGRYEDAARNYRQDWMITRDRLPGGAPRVRWEFAACLLAQGKQEEAEQLLDGLQPVADLPEWARKLLESRP